MKKPWSITTTLRNPERLRNFLVVLEKLENYSWDSSTQKKFQILLIKERVYGFGSPQFYNGLSRSQIELLNDPTKEISYKQAEKIFNTKNYEDPAMRGRQSINPIKKYGFAVIKDQKITITSLGRLFLQDRYDLGEIFFKSFIKWQIPNPVNNDYKFVDGYDIKPFIGVMHLIHKVNEKYNNIGEKAKGISKEEFCLFCPSLVNYNDIESYSDRIILLRDKLKNKNKNEQNSILIKAKKDFAKKFLGTSNNLEIQKLLKNLNEYGDNAIRYFRMTRFIYIRGGGFYIDLEPRRTVEISNLLEYDNAQSKDFTSIEDYLEYISDILQPQLPWETKEILVEIAKKLLDELRQYEKEIGLKYKEIPNYKEFNITKIKRFIDELRNYRRDIYDMQNRQKSQEIDEINNYIVGLKDIFRATDKSILLEKLLTLGLNALNDALIIKPNYPVGDDNEPTFTAPANTPDIECFYEKYNAICEVTMLTNREQWYNEGQPVMRHLRDFEEKYKQKEAYCLFIAPRIHRDTINTFWNAVKYEFEGQKQKIIPLTIGIFIELLKILVEIKQKGKFLKHHDLFNLYDEILESSNKLPNSDQWLGNIPNIITIWKKGLGI